MYVSASQGLPSSVQNYVEKLDFKIQRNPAVVQEMNIQLLFPKYLIAKVHLFFFCHSSSVPRKFSFQVWKNKKLLPSQETLFWASCAASLLSEWWKDLSMPDTAEFLPPGTSWMKGCKTSTLNHAKTRGLKPALCVGTWAHRNPCFLKVIYFSWYPSCSLAANSTECGIYWIRLFEDLTGIIKQWIQ